jgi:hypothetical protein
MHTAQEWNALPTIVFSEQCSLDAFKAGVNSAVS